MAMIGTIKNQNTRIMLGVLTVTFLIQMVVGLPLGIIAGIIIGAVAFNKNKSNTHGL